MAGYWPSSSFAFLRTKTKSSSIITQKKKNDPAILTEQAWSIKDLLYGFILYGFLEILHSRPYKIYFQCSFGLACNYRKQGILNCF